MAMENKINKTMHNIEIILKNASTTQCHKLLEFFAHVLYNDSTDSSFQISKWLYEQEENPTDALFPATLIREGEKAYKACNKLTAALRDVYNIDTTSSCSDKLPF